MKQFIVLMAMISLGCALYGMIAGDDDSIYSSTKELWRNELEMVK